MKQLVAVAYDIESARVKSLRKMTCVQKCSKESKHKLSRMNELWLKQALVWITEKETVQDGNTVIAVGPSKGTQAHDFSQGAGRHEAGLAGGDGTYHTVN